MWRNLGKSRVCSASWIYVLGDLALRLTLNGGYSDPRTIGGGFWMFGSLGWASRQLSPERMGRNLPDATISAARVSPLHDYQFG